MTLLHSKTYDKIVFWTYLDLYYLDLYVGLKLSKAIKRHKINAHYQ